MWIRNSGLSQAAGVSGATALEEDSIAAVLAGAGGAGKLTEHCPSGRSRTRKLRTVSADILGPANSYRPHLPCRAMSRLRVIQTQYIWGPCVSKLLLVELLIQVNC